MSGMGAGTQEWNLTHGKLSLSSCVLLSPPSGGSDHIPGTCVLPSSALQEFRRWSCSQCWHSMSSLPHGHNVWRHSHFLVRGEDYFFQVIIPILDLTEGQAACSQLLSFSREFSGECSGSAAAFSFFTWRPFELSGMRESKILHNTQQVQFCRLARDATS